MGIFDNFMPGLEDPERNRMMMDFGLRLMGQAGQGSNTLSGIGQAGLGSMGTYNQIRNQSMTNKLREMQLKREEEAEKLRQQQQQARDQLNAKMQTKQGGGYLAPGGDPNFSGMNTSPELGQQAMRLGMQTQQPDLMRFGASMQEPVEKQDAMDTKGMYNTIVKYNKAKRSGVALTQEDEDRYAAAYETLTQPKLQQMPDGSVIESRIKLDWAAKPKYMSEGSSDYKVIKGPTQKPLSDKEQERLSGHFNTLDALERAYETVDETGRLVGTFNKYIGVPLGLNDDAEVFEVAATQLNTGVQGLIQGIPSNFDSQLYMRLVPQFTSPESLNRKRIAELRKVTKSLIRDKIAYSKATGGVITEDIISQARKYKVDIEGITAWDGKQDPFANSIGLLNQGAARLGVFDKEDEDPSDPFGLRSFR